MKNLTLETVAKGSASEQFQLALQEVIENALDPNTKPKAARTITMTFTFTPNELREMAAQKLQVTTSLAPKRAVEDVIYFGANRRTGEVVATCNDPAQLELGDDPDDSDDSDVVPIGHSDRRAK